MVEVGGVEIPCPGVAPLGMSDVRSSGAECAHRYPPYGLDVPRMSGNIQPDAITPEFPLPGIEGSDGQLQLRDRRSECRHAERCANRFLHPPECADTSAW